MRIRNLNASDRDTFALLQEEMWENTVLRAIGESLELPEVVGCICDVRGRDCMISIWVSIANHLGLRNTLREACRVIIQDSRKKHQASANVVVQFNTFQSRLQEATGLANNDQTDSQVAAEQSAREEQQVAA